tara:strand:+ start:533 stop:778 length:246 start_codon:yes stop_codon:yes gene_type:complete
MKFLQLLGALVNVFCEHFDVVPDMLVIGKGLGGGIFPLAAFLVREDLDLIGDRALGHYIAEKALLVALRLWPQLIAFVKMG